MPPIPRVHKRRLLSLLTLAVSFALSARGSFAEQFYCPEYPELSLKWQSAQFDPNELENTYSSVRSEVTQPGYAACFWEFLQHEDITKERWEKSAERCRNPMWQARSDTARRGCRKWNEARSLLKAGDGDSLKTRLKEAKAKRKELDRYFPDDGRVLGVLDNELNGAQQVLAEAATKKAGEKMASLKDSGSLKGAASIQGLEGKTLDAKQKALDTMFTGDDRRSDLGGDSKSPGTQLKDGAVQGGGTLLDKGHKLPPTDGNKAVPEPQAAKPAEEEGMSTAKKLGLGAGALVLGGIGLLLGGGTSKAHAGEFSDPRAEAGANFSKLNPNAEDQKRFGDGLKSLGGEAERTKALSKFNGLSEGQRNYFLKQMRDGYGIEQALDDAAGKSSLL